MKSISMNALYLLDEYVSKSIDMDREAEYGTRESIKEARLAQNEAYEKLEKYITELENK